MEVISLAVTEPTDVAAARRAAMACAREIGFAEPDVGRVALVATEAATNVVKHAGGGTIVVNAVAAAGDGSCAVDVVAIDHGPGMADLDACFADGYSTAGSPGTGLGALQRLSTLFDCYSQPGLGTVVLSRVAPAHTAPPPPRNQLVGGGVSIPYPGELVCGDDWTIRFDRGSTTLVVCDGLGHGSSAHEAARAGTRAFTASQDHGPADLVAMIHEALRHTRGAAVAVARIEPAVARVRFCGVGNISAAVVAGATVRHLVSQNGTLGREARRIQEFTYGWPDDGVLLLHSDGVATRWRLQDYAGLTLRHPSVIAAVLLRDFRRGRDDATVCVVRRGLNGHE